MHARPEVLASRLGVSLWQSGALPGPGADVNPAQVWAPSPCEKGLLTSSSARVWSGRRRGSWSCRELAAAPVEAACQSPWQHGHREALARGPGVPVLGLQPAVLAFGGLSTAARGCPVPERWGASVATVVARLFLRSGLVRSSAAALRGV